MTTQQQLAAQSTFRVHITSNDPALDTAPVAAVLDAALIAAGYRRVQRPAKPRHLHAVPNSEETHA